MSYLLVPGYWYNCANRRCDERHFNATADAVDVPSSQIPSKFYYLAPQNRVLAWSYTWGHTGSEPSHGERYVKYCDTCFPTVQNLHLGPKDWEDFHEKEGIDIYTPTELALRVPRVHNLHNGNLKPLNEEIQPDSDSDFDDDDVATVGYESPPPEPVPVRGRYTRNFMNDGRPFSAWPYHYPTGADRYDEERYMPLNHGHFFGDAMPLYMEDEEDEDGGLYPHHMQVGYDYSSWEPYTEQHDQELSPHWIDDNAGGFEIGDRGDDCDQDPYESDGGYDEGQRDSDAEPSGHDNDQQAMMHGGVGHDQGECVHYDQSGYDWKRHT